MKEHIYQIPIWALGYLTNDDSSNIAGISLFSLCFKFERVYDVQNDLVIMEYHYGIRYTRP